MPAPTACIAWVTMNGREPTGQYRDRYRTEPVYRPALMAYACVWACDASAADIAKAQAYAAANGYTVVMVDASERDPLALARSKALHLHHQGQLATV